MKRNFRLTRRKEFARVKEKGKSRHHKFIILEFVPNNLNYSRAAFVASKSVGNAVIRNHVKRRMKACVANSWSNIKSGWDLVFFARNASIKASYNDLREAISGLIIKADLFVDR